MDTTDQIALWALGVAGASLLWQIISQIVRGVRGRRRLKLTATIVTRTADREGGPWAEQLVHVTAHAIRGPIGLKNIHFEWNPTTPDGASWGVEPELGGRPTLEFRVSHPPLQTGETATWYYRLGTEPGPGVNVAYQVRAVATQFDTRKLARSGPVLVLPDVRVGPQWAQDTLIARLQWQGTVKPWPGDDAAAPETSAVRVKRWLRGLLRRAAR